MLKWDASQMLSIKTTRSHQNPRTITPSNLSSAQGAKRKDLDPPKKQKSCPFLGIEPRSQTGILKFLSRKSLYCIMNLTANKGSTVGGKCPVRMIC